jgi:hypothetical protein
MIDRDTVIDLVERIDSTFMKREVGTYTEFDKYATFALYIEALAIKQEREACAKVCEEAHWSLDDRNEYAAAIRARGQK